MRAMIQSPKASSIRLSAALLLALCLAGCGEHQVKIEVSNIAADSRGQVRLCGVSQPLDPVRGVLTTTMKACNGKGDLLVVTENAQFAHCEFGPASKGKNQTYRFKLDGVNCVAEP